MSIEKNTINTLNHIGGGFTTIRNETIDSIPTKGALGVYLYLARKPQDWVVREKDLQNRFGCGRDAIRTDLKTLSEYGLYESVAIRNESGKIVKWVTNLYKTPKCSIEEEQNNHITENPSSGENHITGNPQCGLHNLSQNPTHTNKRFNTKERERESALSVDNLKKEEKKPMTENPLTAEPSTVKRQYLEPIIRQNVGIQILHSTPLSNVSKQKKTIDKVGKHEVSTVEAIKLLQSKGCTPKVVIDKFFAHHRSEGTRKADWQAAFMKWCLAERGLDKSSANVKSVVPEWNADHPSHPDYGKKAS